MKLKNDKTCGWINDLPKRININSINKDEKCDFLIIGAFFRFRRKSQTYV